MRLRRRCFGREFWARNQSLCGQPERCSMRLQSPPQFAAIDTGSECVHARGLTLDGEARIADEHFKHALKIGLFSTAECEARAFDHFAILRNVAGKHADPAPWHRAKPATGPQVQREDEHSRVREQFFEIVSETRAGSVCVRTHADASFGCKRWSGSIRRPKRVSCRPGFLERLDQQVAVFSGENRQDKGCIRRGQDSIHAGVWADAAVWEPHRSECKWSRAHGGRDNNAEASARRRWLHWVTRRQRPSQRRMRAATAPHLARCSQDLAP